MALDIEKLREVVDAWIEEDCGCDPVVFEPYADELAERLQAALEEAEEDDDDDYFEGDD